MLNQGPPWSPMESHVYDGEDDSELYQKDDIVEDLVVCDKRKQEEES